MVLNVMCYFFETRCTIAHAACRTMPGRSLNQACFKNWTKSTLHFLTSKSFNVGQASAPRRAAWTNSGAQVKSVKFSTIYIIYYNSTSSYITNSLCLFSETTIVINSNNAPSLCRVCVVTGNSFTRTRTEQSIITRQS